jgi:UDP-N-acetyl-2-amino-2-deoxyglucuronate dehydrogenase
MSLNFACIGVAGYIAPRHLQAIKNTKNNLLFSYDKSDTVGILDKYFPNSLFFNDFYAFKKKFINSKKKIDYTVILTPNYTHFKYIKFALSNKSNVICEKPLVLTNYHLKQIEKLEKKYNKKVFTILQLRTLEVIKSLYKEIQKSKKNHNVLINYITPRGHWYQKSWKGNIKKSGGVLFNIGIHLLDVLCYLFGNYLRYNISKKNDYSVKGSIEFKNAKANFNLSIDKKDLKKYKNKKVVRDFIIDNKKMDLVKNFEQAHTDSYKAIIEKKDFGLNIVKKAIKLAIDLDKIILYQNK